ncbi:MAG: GumC family protein [Planktomarina sp.]
MTHSPLPASPASVSSLSSGADEIDLGQLFQTLWRGKWWIALCAAVAVFIGGYYATRVAIPEYTAHAVVAFESRENQVVDLQNVMSGLGGDQATINTEVEVLRSRGLVEKLVRKLDLVQDPEFNADLRPTPKFSISNLLGTSSPAPQRSPSEVFNAVVDTAMEKITVSNVRQSYVFKITVVTQNAEKSARIANTMADVYILDQLEVKFAATEQATAWLTERVGELQIALEDSVEAVKDFNANSSLVSPEAVAALNRQIKDLRERGASAQDTIARLKTRLGDLQALQTGGDFAAQAAVANDPGLTRMLEMHQNGSLTDMAPFTARFDDLVTRAQVDLDRAQAQAAAVQKSITDLETQVAAQADDLIKLQQLEREAEANKLIYEFFLARLKETSVQQGIQQADSRVLSPAVVPRTPSAPRKAMVLALSLIVGAIIGAAIIIGRELAQNTFRTAEDLEQLTGQTVLGQIPMIPARRGANVLGYLIDKPTSAAAEAVRNLRTSVLMSNVDKTPQIILSTSSLPGEGKTTQSISLAHNLSGLGKKVLLIEGDIRRRVFSQYFDIKSEDGLLAVLSGKCTIAEAAVHNDALGADILMGEKSSTNAADVFSSAAFEKFLNDLRGIYDYIIIDTPPVLIVPDARVIGQHVDAILYTVRWDHTTKRQVIEGLHSFETVNLKVTGLVLGQIDARQMKRYGYGDYAGYGYGKGYYDN